MKINRLQILAMIFIFSVASLMAQNYPLVWSDEFDGPEINSANWTHEIGGGGWGNNELEYYTDRAVNSYIDNGVLVVKALSENYGGRNYTSARMITRGKKFWRYGKIEARMRLPYGQGIWPAFWMLGEQFTTVGWPACGEIDIMEMVGGDGDNRVHGTIHFDNNGYQSWGGHYVLPSGIFADDFHVFAIHWTPEKIEWYLDDILYYDADIQAAGMTEFHENFFIILNLAVGGNWPGNPDATTVFPQTLEVDYVRVYQDTSGLAVVNMTEPGNNSTFAAGEIIPITAEVNYGGEVENVEFYQGQVKIGETSLYPYQMNWRDVQPGSYQVSGRVVTVSGIDVLSDPVTVTVGDGAGPSPYTGYGTPVPGIIEAENYDLGGPNVAYYDTDVQNSGYQYRADEQVDIERCSDNGGGYNVGWINTNEWLMYTVDVHQAGSYTIDVRVAANAAGSAYRIDIDGSNQSGTVFVPATGGWQNWITLSVENVTLGVGIHNLKFVAESGGFNLNNISFQLAGAQAVIELTEPNGGEVWPAQSIQEIRWYNNLVSSVNIDLSTDGGSSWFGIATNVSGEFGVYRWLVSEEPSANCLLRIESATDAAVFDVSDEVFSIADPTGIESGHAVANYFTLHQNYPNPFNPLTRIAFNLPVAGPVRLVVYDIQGRVVATLLDGVIGSGSQEVQFDGTGLPSGVYMYIIQSGTHTATKKMVLLK